MSFEHRFWYETDAIKNVQQLIRVRIGMTEGLYGRFFHDIEHFSQKSMVFIGRSEIKSVIDFQREICPPIIGARFLNIDFGMKPTP